MSLGVLLKRSNVLPEYYHMYLLVRGLFSLKNTISRTRVRGFLNLPFLTLGTMEEMEGVGYISGKKCICFLNGRENQSLH